MSTADGAATGPPDLHVLIVGAGIAGLSAAISCREKGFRVTALESVAEFSHVGAGLGISSNGSRILRDMGVEEEVRRRGTVLKSVQFLRHGDGTVVKEQDFGDAEQRWGAPLWQIHRGDLHDVLLARARRAGVEIRMDARVDEYDPAGPGVLLADGSRIAADVMLCADGYRSPARAALLGAPSEPRPCGNAAYRALVDVKLLPDDPSLAPLLDHENEVSFSWLGPLRHVVGYTLRQGTLFNLVLTGPAMRTRAEAGKYVVTVDPKEVLEEYKDWDTRLLTILKQLPENTLEWNLCDLDPLESWVFGGKTVLMGDAAHPVLPSSGQGAVLAIEDGSAIAELLARTSDRAQIPSALRTFQKLRQPRAATTLQIGRADANKWHEKDTTKGGTSTPVLWGYDVKEAARSIDFV